MYIREKLQSTMRRRCRKDLTSDRPKYIDTQCFGVSIDWPLNLTEVKNTFILTKLQSALIIIRASEY